MPKKYLIKSPPAASGPLENIKTGGEDPSRLSGAIGYVKTWGSSPPHGCEARLYTTNIYMDWSSANWGRREAGEKSKFIIHCCKGNVLLVIYSAVYVRLLIKPAQIFLQGGKQKQVHYETLSRKLHLDEENQGFIGTLDNVLEAPESATSKSHTKKSAFCAKKKTIYRSFRPLNWGTEHLFNLSVTSLSFFSARNASENVEQLLKHLKQDQDLKLNICKYSLLTRQNQAGGRFPRPKVARSFAGLLVKKKQTHRLIKLWEWGVQRRFCGR